MKIDIPQTGSSEASSGTLAASKLRRIAIPIAWRN
jgi:hypothetical protein